MRYRLQHALSVDLPGREDERFDEFEIDCAQTLPRVDEDVEIDGACYRVVAVFHPVAMKTRAASPPIVRVK
jgi:hypothetical protein